MVIFAFLLLGTLASGEVATWQLIGNTYNSVVFLDRNRVSGAESQIVTVVRVSGQPERDGWRKVVQHIRVDCASGIMGDAGSTIHKADSSQVTYGPSFAVQPKPTRGVFLELFKAVCEHKRGPLVSDPESWTHTNFKFGM